MAALKLDCSVLTIVACIIIGSSCIDANTWCMINNNATPNVLQNNLDYACSHGADCSAIQPGASCFKPDNVFRHAAYAYDSYYVNHGKTPESCNFAGTGHVIHNDPSMNIHLSSFFNTTALILFIDLILSDKDLVVIVIKLWTKLFRNLCYLMFLIRLYGFILLCV
ncbi:putative glucan endo-1,3-beta-D-glucosidase [Lupinus albus]|uniref:Putative glucan endo-1,3-beta-D-glucosidase n=1 Tax=Lupinus albus TaxID=3870 RepID=A0A6A4PN67_LUPAL|nr:putative glucan endo-1,3-beta-D-glucosidase [Lupinus albus]